MKTAAFFDLDRTLMAGSSGMSWVRASYDAGLISRSQMVTWAREGLVFRLRGSTDVTTKEAMKKISEILTGASARDLERLGPQVLAGVLPRIYPQMLAEVHRHQDEGRATYIVSAAGDELVKELARVLGMDGGLGTAYEVDEAGNFTGELDGPFMYGEGKATTIRELAEEKGYDLSESHAYSDSASDLPMLRVVGNPVVVSPDAELAGIAADEGWPIMRLDRLGRRLAGAGALSLVAIVGAATAIAVRRAIGPNAVDREKRSRGYKTTRGRHLTS